MAKYTQGWSKVWIIRNRRNAEMGQRTLTSSVQVLLSHKVLRGYDVVTATIRRPPDDWAYLYRTIGYPLCRRFDSIQRSSEAPASLSEAISVLVTVGWSSTYIGSCVPTSLCAAVLKGRVSLCQKNLA